jgi:hypothetical protein
VEYGKRSLETGYCGQELKELIMDSCYRQLICLLERMLSKEQVEIVLNTKQRWCNNMWSSVYRDMYVVPGGVVSKHGTENARNPERWRWTVMKAGGGVRKQVARTGLLRRERAGWPHVPVREKLWLSDEPKRNVCNFVNDVCDDLIRQSLDHFRNTCCGDRIDLETSYKSDLPWDCATRFVDTCCYTRICCWSFKNNVYVCHLLQLGGLCSITLDVSCSGCCQSSQLSDIKT